MFTAPWAAWKILLNGAATRSQFTAPAGGFENLKLNRYLFCKLTAQWRLGRQGWLCCDVGIVCRPAGGLEDIYLTNSLFMQVNRPAGGFEENGSSDICCISVDRSEVGLEVLVFLYFF